MQTFPRIQGIDIRAEEEGRVKYLKIEFVVEYENDITKAERREIVEMIEQKLEHGELNFTLASNWEKRMAWEVSVLRKARKT